MSEIKIYDKRLKGIEEKCSICKDSSKMYGTGNLIYSELSNDWVLEFSCPAYNEISRIWHVKYEPLIQEILKDEGIIK